MNKTLLEEQIKKIKQRMGLLEEKTKRAYEYGCVMLYFTFPEIKEIHNLIDEKDVYIDKEDDSFGLEDEPHTTLLFGLHDGLKTSEVKKILDKYTFDSCKLHNPSLFNNEKYDVLKFDVEGENLHKVNKELKKFPYTSDYPNYHPHLTIGYLKKGTGKKYVDILKKEKLIKFFLLPQEARYSKPDGTKDKIIINVD